MSSLSYYWKINPPKETVKDIERFLEELKSYGIENPSIAYSHCPIYLEYNRETDPITYLDLLDRYTNVAFIEAKNDVIRITTTLDIILSNEWQYDLLYLSKDISNHYKLITYIIDIPKEIENIPQCYSFTSFKLKNGVTRIIQTGNIEDASIGFAISSEYNINIFYDYLNE